MGWWSADRRISVDSAIASAILTGAAKENTMSDEPTGSEPASREHMAPQGAPGPQQPPYSQYQPPAPASPPHSTQLMSTSADGSVNGKYDGRSRI